VYECNALGLHLFAAQLQRLEVFKLNHQLLVLVCMQLV
jgi:hypothetical protein